MVEAKARGPAAIIRPILLLTVLGVIGFFVWRHFTHREGYTRGDVVTTGTIEAVHIELSQHGSDRRRPIDQLRQTHLRHPPKRS